MSYVPAECLGRCQSAVHPRLEQAKKGDTTDLPCEPDEDRACASIIVPRLLHLGSDIAPDGGEVSLTAHTVGRMEYRGTGALDE